MATANSTRNRSPAAARSTKPVYTTEKKGILTCNGTKPVGLKTVHGKFKFHLQRYQVDKEQTNYLRLTKQLESGYISLRLQELCGYYSNRMSYEEVAFLVERVSGSRLLSDQKISQIVSVKP